MGILHRKVKTYGNAAPIIELAPSPVDNKLIKLKYGILKRETVPLRNKKSLCRKQSVNKIDRTLKHIWERCAVTYGNSVQLISKFPICINELRYKITACIL